MDKVKSQAKQAYLKLKQQLDAKEEQLQQALRGGGGAVGEGGEGGPDDQLQEALSQLAAAEQRANNLEAKVQAAKVETDKVKSDAKKVKPIQRIKHTRRLRR